MANPFLGQVILYAGTLTPPGWAVCNGQLLQLTQYTALYTLLGTTYGGDGISTFGVPDFQGRAPVCYGQGNGLSNYSLGEKAGVEDVTLLTEHLPAHSHAINALSAGTFASPVGNFWAGDPGGSLAIYSSGETDTELNPQGFGLTGGGNPHDNLPPSLVMNYIIALQGTFPERQ